MRRVIEFVLRIFSYVFTLGSSVGMLGLGLVSKLSGNELKMDNMPWKGDDLATWLVGIGVFGLLSAGLAALTKGPGRFLLPLFGVFLAYLMVNGNFLTPAKSYENLADFQQTAWYTGGTVVNALASLLQLKKKP